jgi:hypothetical protein
MSRKSEYHLVNPYILGNDVVADGSDAEHAAKQIWPQVAKYFSSPLKKFHITLQNQMTGGHHHFEISEQKNGDRIDFHIGSYDSVTKDTMDRFESKLRDAKIQSDAAKQQMGGASDNDVKDKDRDSDDDDRPRKKKHQSRKKDSSSSSDDERDYYKRGRSKVRYDSLPMEPWNWIYWQIYPEVDYWFPTFVAPITPSVRLVPLYWVY